MYNGRRCHLAASGLYDLLPADQPNVACMCAFGVPSFACGLRWTPRMVVDVEVAVVCLLILPWLLYLPWHVIFFNKWPVNGRSDELRRHDRYSIELAQTYNQCRKSWCSVGLFWVHWVCRRCNAYKLMDDIWDELCHMNIDLRHNVVDQLTFS